MGAPSLEAPRNLTVSVMEDRKQKLQGERHSVLIYFRRTWGNVLYHSSRLCPFELCRIVLYTLHSCVLGSLCVGSPAGSLRTYKKASLDLAEERLSSAGRTCWKSLFRTIKRQPQVLWGNRQAYCEKLLTGMRGLPKTPSRSSSQNKK